MNYTSEMRFSDNVGNTTPSLPFTWEVTKRPLSTLCRDFDYPVRQVVIDGEVWMIFVPGGKAYGGICPVLRYKGPDLEHLERQPDGVADLSGASGHLGCGMWWDEQNVHVGDSLESMGCQKALEMALEQLPPDRIPIHHSDRGCQYCCHEYVQMLKSRWLSISMTEENHCYENAMAERINGILKQEYALDTTFCTKEQAVKVFMQAIELYNNKRPHLSLDYRTPEQVHRRAA